MIDRLFNVDSKDVFDNPFFHGEYDLLICNSLKGFYRRLLRGEKNRQDVPLYSKKRSPK